ncbi:MAG: nucleotidyltransferase domain-containing protein [Firmicutes bacterium]|nr:nucleotidyltransferase domain-containing protein [Bacillota bacterium]
MRFGLGDKKVEKLTRALRQSKRVKKAVIFGSRARVIIKYLFFYTGFRDWAGWRNGAVRKP